MAGWPVILTGWLVTVDVVEVGVVNTRYSVSQPGADAERYRCTRVYNAHRGWLGVVTGVSEASTGGVLICFNIQSYHSVGAVTFRDISMTLHGTPKSRCIIHLKHVLLSAQPVHYVSAKTAKSLRQVINGGLKQSTKY